jgi:acyl-CoA reductase-like NAD-dependent aldehyde dehydrogenase
MTSAIKVRNPRTGEDDYEFVPPSMEEIKACTERLRQASRDWSRRGLQYRTDVMQRWKQAIAASRAEILNTLARDTGRYRICHGEIDAIGPMIDQWCALAPALLEEQTRWSVAVPSIKYQSQFVPYELIGVISPWNFPLLLSLIDAVPALAAGCSVIIKPSEITPRFAEPLKQTIAAVPELNSVLALLPGAGETGAALVGEVDAVCFTGSIKTGRIVAEAAAKRFIPAFLELGGKDPAIVVESADLERATTAILRASIAATGQACQSLERIYVQETIFEEFVEQLVAKAREVTLNYPNPHEGHLGPLIFERQAEIIADHIAEAVEKGAKILCGGAIEHHGGGKWMLPTVLVNVHHAMKLMTEETFGPLMPVMPFRNVDEAIALANDSDYGLSAAVFAGTEEEAIAIARRIEAGAISINDGGLTSSMHEAEKNAFKFSGLGGARMGPVGLLRFFRKKALIVQTGEPASIARLDEASWRPVSPADELSNIKRGASDARS